VYLTGKPYAGSVATSNCRNREATVSWLRKSYPRDFAHTWPRHLTCRGCRFDWSEPMACAWRGLRP